MAASRTWKREYDGHIARWCRRQTVNAIYGTSVLDVKDVFDESGTPIPDHSTDELACRLAASGARSAGLIQAWSIAEGPNGFSAMVLRFDGQAARNIETTPAAALCWLLFEISQKRN
jgi:hypothetical protein